MGTECVSHFFLELIIVNRSDTQDLFSRSLWQSRLLTSALEIVEIHNGRHVQRICYGHHGPHSQNIDVVKGFIFLLTSLFHLEHSQHCKCAEGVKGFEAEINIDPAYHERVEMRQMQASVIESASLLLDEVLEKG